MSVRMPSISHTAVTVLECEWKERCPPPALGILALSCVREVKFFLLQATELLCHWLQQLSLTITVYFLLTSFLMNISTVIFHALTPLFHFLIFYDPLLGVVSPDSPSIPEQY